MLLNRDYTDQLLINKNQNLNFIDNVEESIKLFPIIDTNNKDLEKKYTDGQLKTLKSYAIAYDFLANIVHQMKKQNAIDKIIDYDKNYYKIRLKEEHFDNYFSIIKDHNLKQNQKTVLDNQLIRGGQFVLQAFYNDISWDEVKPFVQIYRGNKDEEIEYREILLSKLLFQPMIEDTCTLKGADGYMFIPERLYPIASFSRLNAIKNFTSTALLDFIYSQEELKKEFVTILHNLNLDCLQYENQQELLAEKNAPEEIKEFAKKALQKAIVLNSANPLYKLQVLGIKKNTNKVRTISINKIETLNIVAPEYINKSGKLKISGYKLHNELTRGLEEMLNIINTSSPAIDQQQLLVSNLYMGKSNEDIRLYFINHK